MPIKRLVFSSSLICLLLASALGDFQSLSKQLSGVHSSHEAANILRSNSDASKDETLLKLADWTLKVGDSPVMLQRIQDQVALRARIEQPVSQVSSRASIQSIKHSPLYKDPSIKSQSNWFKEAMDNFGKLFDHDWSPPKANIDSPKLPNLEWLKYVLYGILWLALLAFGIFAVRYFTFSRSLKRKAAAILEEDEPERTLDEWLLMADQLESEGKYREAVRCLYLACLLKFDESGIARFIRGETNWEHLARIHASPNLPPNLDFLTPTKRFDLVWYGFRGRGKPDVDDFRGWYLTVSEALRSAKAA